MRAVLNRVIYACVLSWALQVTTTEENACIIDAVKGTLRVFKKSLQPSLFGAAGVLTDVQLDDYEER